MISNVRNQVPFRKKVGQVTEDFVTVKGKKCYVKHGVLQLGHKGINDISDIKGLEHLTKLQELDLCSNRIKEIKGLEALTNLTRLDLSGNQIEEIKGLENLTNLEVLDLHGNRIVSNEQHLLEKQAQEIVKYCQEKARTAK